MQTYAAFQLGFHCLPKYMLRTFKYMVKACLTQNTRLIQLAIHVRVNGTCNRTNRGFIRVTLGQFECIRESRVWFLKLLKKLTRVPCPWIIVLAIVQDCERPCETVRDRVRSYETVWDRIYNRTWSPLHEAKPSKRINFISKHARMCDNSSITRTKVGGAVCKPCKCAVNRVKVVLKCTRP